MGQEGYLELLEQRVKPRLGTEFDEKSWDGFKSRLRFHALDAGRAADYAELANALGVNSERITVCYLATAPHLFITICQQLAKVVLNHANVRIVQIGRAHVCTPVTNAHLICRIMLEKKKL